MDFIFGLILYVVAQRCIPTIFDVDDIIYLILANSANVSNSLISTVLDEVTLTDIEDGTV